MNQPSKDTERLPVDVTSNRDATKYSTKEQLLRVLWACTHPLFRLSPRPLFKWRVFLLRIFGAKVGKQVHVCPSARIFFPWMLSIGDQSAIDEDCLIYNIGLLTIGRSVTISRGAYLCCGTHEYAEPSMRLIRSTITIEDDCWICTEAYVGPAVTVHRSAIAGARAVVTKDVESGKIVAGNPAVVIKNRWSTESVIND